MGFEAPPIGWVRLLSLKALRANVSLPSVRRSFAINCLILKVYGLHKIFVEKSGGGSLGGGRCAIDFR